MRRARDPGDPLAGLAGGLPVPVLMVDAALCLVAANAAWRDLFGLADGVGGRGWLSPFDRATRRRVEDHVRRAAPDGIEVAHGDGQGRWATLWSGPADADDPDDERLVVVAVDVTDARRREAALAFDSTHDPLTGLQNRSAVLDKTSWAIARLGRRPAVVAVLFVDLDHFTDVNDRYGHRTGDEVLVALAGRLAGAVRPSDVVGRVGGDEFVVLCEGLAGEDEAASVADRLVSAVGAPLVVAHGIEVTVGATVGVAVTSSHRDDAVALVDRADRAMYAAKRGHQRTAGPPPDDHASTVAAHLSGVERRLRRGWAGSLAGGDPDAASRWLTAGALVRRATIVLRGDAHG